MKKLIISIIVILFVNRISAQSPIKWKFSAEKITQKTFEVHFTAILDSGWHIYSQSMPMNGPMPTTIRYAKNPLLLINVGKPAEIGQVKQKFESAFGVMVKYYHNKVDFVQLVTLTKQVKTSIQGNIQYMGCNEKMCLPSQKAEFSIRLR